MNMPSLRLPSGLASALVATSLVTAAPAFAAPTKDECVEAHGRGQDFREEGRLTKARQVFLTCSQAACPALVQSDCARFAEELGRLVPSVTFVARDAHATDLPNTSVYLDEQLVASRLDEGKSYDVDPGKHSVRFVHDGKEVSMRVVVSQGEKGRNVIATFTDSAGAEASGSGTRPPVGGEQPAPPPEPSRPIFPLVLAGAGGVAAAVGVVFIAIGLGKVPSTCNNSTKECAAPPGDKTFDDAHSGVSMANTGVVLGIAGAAIAATGLVWYFAQTPHTPTRTGKTSLSPWVGQGSGGFSFAGAF
jgi:hypothetical protein